MPKRCTICNDELDALSTHDTCGEEGRCESAISTLSCKHCRHTFSDLSTFRQHVAMYHFRESGRGRTDEMIDLTLQTLRVQLLYQQVQNRALRTLLHIHTNIDVDEHLRQIMDPSGSSESESMENNAHVVMENNAHAVMENNAHVNAVMENNAHVVRENNAHVVMENNAHVVMERRMSSASASSTSCGTLFSAILPPNLRAPPKEDSPPRDLRAVGPPEEKEEEEKKCTVFGTLLSSSRNTSTSPSRKKDERKKKINTREVRKRLEEFMVTTPLDDYILHVQEEAKKLDEGCVRKYLTALDQRLIGSPGYVDSVVEPDDLERFEICLSLSIPFYPYYTSEIFSSILNHGCALYPLETCIKRVLTKMKDTVIYTPKGTSTAADPYSFYLLSEEGVWRMDCRCEQLVSDLQQSLIPYITSLFRRLYFEVLHDYDYHPEKMDCCPVLEYDCSQLLTNTILLVNPWRMRKMVMGIVIEMSADWKESEDDEFEFVEDDKIQREIYYNQMKKGCLDEVTEAIRKQVFDKITEREAREIIRKYR